MIKIVFLLKVTECLYTQSFKIALSLQKHPIQIYWKIHHKKKTENFQIKNSNIFHISAQNIDCRHSLEAVLTSTHNLCFFLRRNKNNNVYPCKPQFYYTEIRLKGAKIMFSWNFFLIRLIFFDAFFVLLKHAFYQSCNSFINEVKVPLTELYTWKYLAFKSKHLGANLIKIY